MSVAAHVEELRRKHQSLALKVEEAERSPGMDHLEVAELKKQKLRLKEEIERLNLH